LKENSRLKSALVVCIVVTILLAGSNVWLFIRASSTEAHLDALRREHSRLIAEYNNLGNRYRELESTCETLRTSYDSLQSEHATLEVSYRNLQSEYSSFRNRYDELQQNYEILKGDYQALLDQYNTLLAEVAEYESLQQDYETLYSEFTALSSAYKTLESQMEILRQIAEENKFMFYYASLAKQRYGIDDLEEYLERWQWSEGSYVEGVFDCSEMSAYMEWRLENEGYHTYIVCGEAPWGGEHHAWLLVETSAGYYMPVEATTFDLVKWDNPYFDNYFKYDHIFETIQDALEYNYEEYDWWD